MDERACKALVEFAERLRQVCPAAKVEIKDFKWSTEDVNTDVWIPSIADEEEEADLHDKISELTGDIFYETGVYILALTRASDTAEV